MTTPSLFREIPTKRSEAKWLGEIVLSSPLSSRLLTTLAACIATLIMLFLTYGQYTKRTTVIGELVPDKGVLKIYSPQPGLVLRKLVREGQRVHKGDLLYVVSSERQSASDEVQASISRAVAIRQQSLHDQILQTRKLQREEAQALKSKFDAAKAEELNIARQIEAQTSRKGIAEVELKRVVELRSQGYISAQMAQQKEADLLDQQVRLNALDRDRINAHKDVESTKSAIETLPLRQQNEIAELERTLAAADQEWAESEGRRRISILAPEDGIATTIIAEVGQAVDISRPMASIIPAGASLQVHLYAPSRAIGFVRPGDAVTVRYQSFPYQKFGQAHGQVVYVSRSVLAANEIAGSALMRTDEPRFLIAANLSSQTIKAYGKEESLHAGMLLEADIMHEKRRLYEWVFEPLFSLSGKL